MRGSQKFKIQDTEAQVGEKGIPPWDVFTKTGAGDDAYRRGEIPPFPPGNSSTATDLNELI